MPGWMRMALVCVVAGSVPRSGAAQVSRGEARAELLRRAQDADASGDHARALDLAEQAGQLAMTTSLRLFIVEQQLAVGRLPEALVNAEACLHEAEANPRLVNRATILHDCREHAQSLASRMGRVIVRLPADVLTTRVGVGGVDVDVGSLTTPRPVASGNVIVDATAEGRAPFHQVVAVAVGAVVTVDVVFEPLPSPASPAPVSSGPSASPAVSVASAAPIVPRPPTDRPLSRWPYAVAGTGLASLFASAIFYELQAIAMANVDVDCPLDARPHCFPNANAQGQYADAQTFNVWGGGFMVAGGVLVAAGITWTVIERTVGRRSHAPLRSSPSSGLLVVGRF